MLRKPSNFICVKCTTHILVIIIDQRYNRIGNYIECSWLFSEYDVSCLDAIQTIYM